MVLETQPKPKRQGPHSGGADKQAEEQAVSKETMKYDGSGELSAMRKTE